MVQLEALEATLQSRRAVLAEVQAAAAAACKDQARAAAELARTERRALAAWQHRQLTWAPEAAPVRAAPLALAAALDTCQTLGESGQRHELYSALQSGHGAMELLPWEVVQERQGAPLAAEAEDEAMLHGVLAYAVDGEDQKVPLYLAFLSRLAAARLLLVGASCSTRHQ